MLYRVTHRTTYDYSAPVSLCQNLVHLTPRDVPYQRRLHSELRVTPEPDVFAERTDYHGNPATFFAIQTPHRRLCVEATHVITVGPRPVPDAAATPPWEAVRDGLTHAADADGRAAYPFTFDSRYARAEDELALFARASFPPGRPILEGVLDLTSRIHRDFKYDPKATTIATPLAEVLARRRGVCQDFAHLQIASLRSLGLAARYVSGYLSTVPPPGKERVVGADASHAWLSVFVPGGGWVDVDPTNDVIPSDRHVLLAWGMDYDDVSPIKGVILGGGQHVLKVSVDVLPLVSSAEGETAPSE